MYLKRITHTDYLHQVPHKKMEEREGINWNSHKRMVLWIWIGQLQTEKETKHDLID